MTIAYLRNYDLSVNARDAEAAVVAVIAGFARENARRQIPRANNIIHRERIILQFALRAFKS